MDQTEITSELALGTLGGWPSFRGPSIPAVQEQCSLGALPVFGVELIIS